MGELRILSFLIIFGLTFNYAQSQIRVGNNFAEIGDLSSLGRYVSQVTGNARLPQSIRAPGISVDYAPNSRRLQSVRAPGVSADYDSNGNLISSSAAFPFGGGFPFGNGFPFNFVNQAYQQALPSALGQIPAAVGSYQQIPSNIGSYQQIPNTVNSYQPVPNTINSYQQIPTNNGGFQSIPSNSKPAPAPAVISRRPSIEYPGVTNSLNSANALLKNIVGPAGGGLNFPFGSFYGR